MNINLELWTFVNASHKILLIIQQKTNEIKFKIFLENCRHTFVKNARILTCARIQRKILMFDEVRPSESSFWD